MRAYLSNLNNAPTNPTARPKDLKARFVVWFETQPEISRYRPYSMKEMELALHTPGPMLSPILISLGWRRRRRWESRTHYCRYWVPPQTTTKFN